MMIIHQLDREYQLEMERSLRLVNIDYQQVGFYQSTYLNTHCDRNFLENVFVYLEEMKEAIAVIYGLLLVTAQVDKNAR